MPAFAPRNPLMLNDLWDYTVMIDHRHRPRRRAQWGGIAALLALAVQPAHARLVSWPDGSMLMTANDSRAYSVMYSYSTNAKTAFGYTLEYWREADWQFHGVQANRLLKRWNFPDAQANIYAFGAVGGAYSTGGLTEGDWEPAGFVGFEADVEDRRYYASYEARLYEAGDIDGFFMQKARIGIAPYIAKFNETHLWLLLQVDHYPESDDPVEFTAFVRVFKGNLWAEAGVSDTGEPLFNITFQF